MNIIIIEGNSDQWVAMDAADVTRRHFGRSKYEALGALVLASADTAGALQIDSIQDVEL